MPNTMRQQMVQTLEHLMQSNDRLVVILADISDDLFHRDNPRVAERIFNLGIMEQSMISIGAGFAQVERHDLRFGDGVERAK